MIGVLNLSVLKITVTAHMVMRAVNARGTWRILNEVINRQKKTSDLPSVFKIGEVECNDPVEIANKFCEYFTNLGPSLADKIPTSPKSHMSFLTTNFVNSMFVDSATRQEIIDTRRLVLKKTVFLRGRVR